MPARGPLDRHGYLMIDGLATIIVVFLEIEFFVTGRSIRAPSPDLGFELKGVVKKLLLSLRTCRRVTFNRPIKPSLQAYRIFRCLGQWMDGWMEVCVGDKK